MLKIFVIHIHFLFVLPTLINLKHTKFKIDACASTIPEQVKHISSEV